MSRIKVDRITDRAGTGEPLFPNGVKVVGLTSLSNVVAGIATFENVSIGGTLTYDDVTNVDSTGIVTARGGFKAGDPSGIGVTIEPNGNSQFIGIVTASSFVGDINASSLASGTIPDARLPNPLPAISGANLTNLPPSGNTATLVADGAIAAGKPCIIKTDGKAAQIAETLSPTNPPVANGDSTVTDVKAHVSWVYNTALDKYVVIGKSGDAYWITGTNNAGNTTFSWSSQYLLLGYALSSCMACYHVSQERVIFTWWNGQFSASTSMMVATHGPVLNQASDFNANNSYQIGNRAYPIATVYYPEVNVCCFMFQDVDSNLGRLEMLDTTTSNTVADNLVNKKATIALDGSASIEFGGLATNGTVIVAVYKKGSNTGIYYKIITGTNNTTYTETSEAHYTEGSITAEEIDITYDTNAGKFLMVYKQAGSGNKLRAVVGTLSGTGSSATISWGTPVEMPSAPSTNAGMSCEYDPSRKENLVVYDNSATGYFKYISISGTTPTWGTDTVLLDGVFYPVTAKGNHYSIVHNPDTHQMAVAWQTNSGNSGTSSRYELITGAGINSNLSNDKRNFIGFAEDAISDGATGEIKLRGNVVGNQSGLTPATMYEVQDPGTLTANWQSNSVGLKAIAADKGIISENTGV